MSTAPSSPASLEALVSTLKALHAKASESRDRYQRYQDSGVLADTNLLDALACESAFQESAVNAMPALLDGFAGLMAENADLNALFDLQHTRTVEATKYWRSRNPGNELVSPDLGALLAWLMNRIAELEKAIKRWANTPAEIETDEEKKQLLVAELTLMQVVGLLNVPVVEDDDDSAESAKVSALMAEKAELAAENERLRGAIRKHRDEKGDDRCFLDDYKLYSAIGEPIPESACQLCEPLTMMSNCVRFIQSRHDPAKPYLSPQQQIDELQQQLNHVESYTDFPIGSDSPTAGGPR